MATVLHDDATSHVSSIGRVRVLYVEDDIAQQAAIQILFDAAKEKNEGAVVFQVQGKTVPN